jgi:hypothetical protein
MAVPAQDSRTSIRSRDKMDLGLFLNLDFIGTPPLLLQSVLLRPDT